MNNIELNQLYKRLEDEITYDEYNVDTMVWYNNLINLPLLKKDEEEVLLYQISLGDKRARKIFIQRNLRLVRCIALKYINCGLPFLDIIQEGNVGLIKAIDGYAKKADIAFSSYAFLVIDRCIKRAVDEKTRIISLPVRLMEELKSYNRKVKELTNILGREPTQKEISEHYNIDVDEIKKFEKIYNDVYLMSDITQDCQNLNDIVDYLSIHSISQANQCDIDKIIDRYSLYEIIDKTDLNKNELLFLKLHYGLYGGMQYKQNQISKILNLSTQRISQLKISAIKKLNKTAVSLKYIDKNNKK